jgi:16S rRNA (uracil1498-N3)-methyltransferase
MERIRIHIKFLPGAEQNLLSERRCERECERGFPISEYHLHYLKNVMRLKNGATVSVFNEVQGEFEAVLQGNHLLLGRQIRAGLAQRDFQENENGGEPGEMGRTRRLRLAFSPLKNRHLTHFVIEKVTEIGVTHIHPVIMERTQIRGDSISIDKWNKIAVEAAEQCERLSIPTIFEPTSLHDFLVDFAGEKRMKEEMDGWLWLWSVEREKALLGGGRCGESETEGRARVEGEWRRGVADVLGHGRHQVRDIGAIVGPEGGFSARDCEAIVAHKVSPVSLGRLILRAETAAICVLANIMEMTEWRGLPD